MVPKRRPSTACFLLLRFPKKELRRFPVRPPLARCPIFDSFHFSLTGYCGCARRIGPCPPCFPNVGTALECLVLVEILDGMMRSCTQGRVCFVRHTQSALPISTLVGKHR